MSPLTVLMHTILPSGFSCRILLPNSMEFSLSTGVSFFAFRASAAVRHAFNAGISGSCAADAETDRIMLQRNTLNLIFYLIWSACFLISPEI